MIHDGQRNDERGAIFGETNGCAVESAALIRGDLFLENDLNPLALFQDCLVVQVV